MKASWERALLYVGLLVWLPAIPFALALAIANFTGCELSENDVRPCVVAGLDIGLPLTLMGLMGWLVIALLPFMALTLVAGAVLGFVRLIVAWRRSIRTRKTPKPDFAADRRKVLNPDSRDDERPDSRIGSGHARRVVANELHRRMSSLVMVAKTNRLTHFASNLNDALGRELT